MNTKRPTEQADILISKNQVVQILYFKIMYIKYHKLHIMDKKPNEIHENLPPTKIKQPYCTVLNTNIPYKWPAGS